MTYICAKGACPKVDITHWTWRRMMTFHPTSLSSRRQPVTPEGSERSLTRLLLMFPHGVCESLLAVGGMLFVALIGLLDYGTGPSISFGIFYLIPVAACAWWGGFSHGILLSLAGSVAWSMVDALENPLIPASAQVWNGLARFCTLVLTSSLVARLHAGIRREQLLARTDPLTGAANARTFYELAAAEAERSRRMARPLTLAYFDLDNFKQVNDRMGHAAGDAVLVHVVQTITSQLRSLDLLARLGGDEFGLLLPETGPEGAAALLTRIHELISNEMAAAGFPVTFSVGAITFHRPLLDVDQMVQRIDALMYRAKKTGKGRIEHQTVLDAQEPGNDDAQWIERRATARVLCNSTARIRLQGDEETNEGFATIRDISPSGVGLALEAPFPRETVLIVEPLSAGSRVLLARVVRVSQEEGNWLHGCELATHLSQEELRSWLDAQRRTGSSSDATTAASHPATS
jgi:diguanylate cyclase (GGDEF)-like protein